MPSPTIILGILLALSVAGNTILGKLYVSAKQDVARVQQAYDSFVAQAKAIGEKQEKETAAKVAAAAKQKEQADAENSKTRRDLDGVYAAYRSLRDQRQRSLLPETSASTGSSDSACFDRSALDRGMADADGVLQRGAEKILRRGDEAISDLNGAREWATGR